MWAPGGPAGPAGWDRRRVGARLRAALAGLHELQGLRARQQARVRDALAAQPPCAPAAPRDPDAHELRLEAALAALQEQLNRLRRQDASLKTHLDQLDQQISELQLGVRRTSPEAPDSDSRPSSGFYELSDGGSCSLSASCTSVCSDHLSSSLGTLLPAAPTTRTSTGDCRPWSADETTMYGAPLPTWSPQATKESAGQPLQGPSRPRPVSTGDLERVLSAEVGRPRARADPPAASSLGPGVVLPLHPLDPKYQRDLVSQGGREVYPYPSPLHAVALQSPLFALTRETPQRDGPVAPGESLPGPSGPSGTRTGPVLAAGPARAYIDRLLRRRGPGNPAKGSVSEQGPPRCEVPPSQKAESAGHPEKRTCAPGGAQVGGVLQRRDPGGDSPEQRVPAPPGGTLPPHSLPEEGRKPPGSCVGGGPSPGSPPLRHGPPAPGAQAAECQARLPGGVAVRESPALATGRYVHARRGHPPAKALRTGRGPSGKAPKLGGQPPPWGALAGPPPAPAWGAGLGRRPGPAREAPGRSCSESSLYPVSFLIPLLVARPEGPGTCAPALCPWEAAPPVAAGGEARRKQRHWQSSVELSARGPGAGPPGPAARRGGGPRPACPRARSRPPRPDAPARSESAQPASLCRAAIAETSEGEAEASDHTANRFGDEDSSGGDAEGGVRGPGPPLPPVPRLCRIRASRALRKKIRRFQPAALKVMTMV